MGYNRRLGAVVEKKKEYERLLLLDSEGRGIQKPWFFLEWKQNYFKDPS